MSQADLTALGRLLRERREALDLTREEVSHRVGVTPAYIFLIETAKPRQGGTPSRPKRSVLKRWGEALGMSEGSTSRILELAGYHPIDRALEPQLEAIREQAAGDLRSLIGRHRAPRTTPAIAKPVGIDQSLDATSERTQSLDSVGRRAIWCFSPRESLRTALEYMNREDFSQIVVREDGRLTLLTVEGIAGWLRDQAEEETVSLGEARVEDALAFDLPHNSLVMPDNGTLTDALDAFAGGMRLGQPRIYAIILTQTGRESEEPTGIVTPWDLAPSYPTNQS